MSILKNSTQLRNDLAEDPEVVNLNSGKNSLNSLSLPTSIITTLAARKLPTPIGIISLLGAKPLALSKPMSKKDKKF
jgi:hypothetical protein